MQKKIYTVDGNPMFKHVFTADPSVLVHEEELFIYTGHDDPPPGKEEYVMNDWLCFSSRDGKHWTDHGPLLRATDFGWASGDAYASKVIQRNNKFYWYVAVTHGSIAGKAIGVAVADHPTGPFTDAKGEALITQELLPTGSDEMSNLDPTVIVADDGQAYLLWGKGHCYMIKLKEDMITTEGSLTTIDLPAFSEGAQIHQRNGWFYLSYGYGYPEKVGYAMSRQMNGPWDFKGILNEIAGNCATNRPAIIHFKGNDYFIYHNGGLKEGGSHRRSVCIDRLFYNDDGTMKRVIMTSEGVW